MTKLELTFGWRDNPSRLPQLFRTFFSHPRLCNQHGIYISEIVATRESDAFSWRSAVMSLSYCAVVASCKGELTIRGTHALPLFRHLAKRDVRNWPELIFGWNANHQCMIFEVFQHLGTDASPAIQIHKQCLSAGEISIICDDHPIQCNSRQAELLIDGLRISIVQQRDKRVQPPEVKTRINSEIYTTWTAWKDALQAKDSKPSYADSNAILSASKLLSSSGNDGADQLMFGSATKPLHWNMTVAGLEQGDAQPVRPDQVVELLLTSSPQQWVVQGSAGSGKSTLCKILADIAKSRQMTATIVSFATNPAFGRIDEFMEVVGNTIFQDYPGQSPQHRIQIFDGLEDLYIRQPDPVAGFRVLREFFRCWGHLPVRTILTSRSEFLREFVDESLWTRFPRVDVRPWSRQDVTLYFSALARPLPHSEPLLDIIRTPFYANIYSSFITDLDEDKIPHSRFRLIDSFVSSAVQQICRRHGVSAAGLYRAIELIAWSMRRGQTKALADGEMREILACTLVGVQIEPALIPCIQHSTCGYVFIHDLFSEYLIARQIITEIKLRESSPSLGHFQTTYEEDRFIAEQVQHDKPTVRLLETTYLGAVSDLLAVNVIGILAKMGRYDKRYELLRYVLMHDNVRKLYENAVFGRLRLRSGVQRAQSDTRWIAALQVEIADGTDPVAAMLCLADLPDSQERQILDRSYADRYKIEIQDLLRELTACKF